MNKKICNSDKIIRVVKQNNEKFKVLENLGKKCIGLERDYIIEMDRIKNVFEIIMRNLSFIKKEVGVIGEYAYFVSSGGVGRKHNAWGHNADNITKENIYDTDFRKELLIIKKNIKLFSKHLTKKKFKTFTDFFEKVNLLKIPPQIKIKCDIEVELEDKIKLNIETMKLSLKHNLRVILNQDTRGAIQILNASLEDKVVLEQICSQIKVLIEKTIKQKTNEINKIKKYLSDLDLKFADYIKSVEMLKELNKE